MRARGSLRAEVAETAAQAGSIERRADALLQRLSGVIPYAAGWIAVRDPETRTHRRVGSFGDTEALARHFALPEADDEVEALGLNRFRPPVAASTIPVPLPHTRAWGEYLLPAGFTDGVAMALFTDDGRHLGFLSLLTDQSTDDWTSSYCGLLAGLRSEIAMALDRLSSFATAAQLTGDALGGVVTTRSGRCVPVPGLPTHPLVAEGSAALEVARRHACAPGTASTFLSSWAGTLHRLSVLDCRDETVDHLCALVLVRPPGEAPRLRLSDLRLLGALVEGWEDDRVRACTGVADPDRRAAQLADDLGLPCTAALVLHAAQEGLYLPPPLWPQA